MSHFISSVKENVKVFKKKENMKVFRINTKSFNRLRIFLQIQKNIFLGCKQQNIMSSTYCFTLGLYPYVNQIKMTHFASTITPVVSLSKRWMR